MDPKTLKKFCQFVRTYSHTTYGEYDRKFEDFAFWKQSIIKSQKLGLSVVHYAPECSLEQYIKNITCILENQFWRKNGKMSYYNDNSSNIQFIGKALGYKK